MAYDADGTVGFAWNAPTYLTNWNSAPGTVQPELWDVELTQAKLAQMNNENWDDYENYDSIIEHQFVWMYPEPRELDGVYLNMRYTSSNAWSASSEDSKIGSDGTWTSLGYIGDKDNFTADGYRDNIESFALSNQNGLMVWASSGGALTDVRIYQLHIYGTMSPGSTPDRIIFLDTLSSDAEFSKVLDYGDIPRGQVSTRTIKLKNNSSSYSMNTVVVSAEDLYLEAGDWYGFSLTGSTYSYAASLAIGSLSPGGTKLIHMKQTIDPAATVGPQAGRIKVVHASVT